MERYKINRYANIAKGDIQLLHSHLGGGGVVHQNTNVCEQEKGRCHINASACI